MIREVRVESGIVQGLAVQDPRITVFRGIPYAAPPIGPLRWRAPAPVKPWSGVLRAFDFAPSALQPITAESTFYGREWGVDDSAPMSEDCLYLNVWTPALGGSRETTRLRDGGPRPVMLWIHGGAYQCGSTSEKECDGEELARMGVVVVSVSYRLNVFGFFSHPDLSRQSASRPRPDRANFGLLDQSAALRWVRSNISRFGGDPDRVTLFGQSSGAASVLAHVCSPRDAGLFSRVIMQSGAGVGMFNHDLWSLGEAQATGRLFLDYLSVGSIDEARRLDARTLLEAACRFPASPYTHNHDEWSMPSNWSPCIDGVFLTDQYSETLSRGEGHRVDAIIGNTTHEFMAAGHDGAQVALGEQGNAELVRVWLKGGLPAPYCYSFAVAMPGDDSGAFHSCDLWFTFGTLQKSWRPFTGVHYDVSRAMVAYWTNFAASGDPNGVGRTHSSAPCWERHAGPSGDVLRIAEGISVTDLA